MDIFKLRKILVVLLAVIAALILGGAAAVGAGNGVGLILSIVGGAAYFTVLHELAKTESAARGAQGEDVGLQ